MLIVALFSRVNHQLVFCPMKFIKQIEKQKSLPRRIDGVPVRVPMDIKVWVMSIYINFWVRVFLEFIETTMSFVTEENNMPTLKFLPQ